MFGGLQRKWKVNGLQLLLIISTFAIGGSLSLAKKLMNVLDIDPTWLWIVIYIVFVTIIWPLAVLVVSIPFGQFPFFIRYIKKIGAKIGLIKTKKPA